MKTLFSLLCFITTLPTFAQDKPVLVKMAPLALADGVSFPTIQGGIEFSITPKISWYNEFGGRYRTTSYERTDTSFVAAKGFKAKTELRYYYKQATGAYAGRLTGSYFAVNLYYIRDVHNADARYYYQKDSSKRTEDNFAVRKNVWGINLLTGRQATLGKRFVTEVYIGLGARFRDIFTTNKEFDDDRDDFIGPVDLTIEGVKNKAEAKGGNSVVPTLTLGFRIGFKL